MVPLSSFERPSSLWPPGSLPQSSGGKKNDLSLDKPRDVSPPVYKHKCHRLVGTLAPTCYGAKCMCTTTVLELGSGPSSRGLGLLHLFQDQYGVKKVITSWDRCFLHMDSHRLSRAELASVILRGHYERKVNYLFSLHVLSTSLLSGHQEWGGYN